MFGEFEDAGRVSLLSGQLEGSVDRLSSGGFVLHIFRVEFAITMFLNGAFSLFLTLTLLIGIGAAPLLFARCIPIC